MILYDSFPGALSLPLLLWYHSEMLLLEFHWHLNHPLPLVLDMAEQGFQAMPDSHFQGRVKNTWAPVLPYSSGAFPV